MENSKKGLSTPGLKVTVYGVLGGGEEACAGRRSRPKNLLSDKPIQPIQPLHHRDVVCKCASVQA